MRNLVWLGFAVPMAVLAGSSRRMRPRANWARPRAAAAAVLLIAAGLSTAAAAKDRALGLQPPAPVACAVNACDSDPAHLTDFTVKFFAWYVDNMIAEDALSGPARQRKEQAENAKLDRMLSPSFRANLAKLRKEAAAAKDGEPEPDPTLSSLCGGFEADNITCAQDFDGGWRTAGSAKVDSSTPNKVQLTVTLPWPIDPESKTQSPPDVLVVTLVPDHDHWSIDRIASKN